MNSLAEACFALNCLALSPEQNDRILSKLAEDDPWPSLRAAIPRPDRLKEAIRVASAERRLATKKGFRILTPADPEFPERLKPGGSTAAPAIYTGGDLRALSLPAVAIVGSRAATPYGREVARSLARDLAGRGVAVVSGLARGIDSQAHLGAVETGGVTIAILGSGLCRCYPSENTRLARTIRRSGLLLSEFPLAAPPRPHHFPRRNRIIAALADVVVVVEATRKSGSRHTAMAAAALGRTVMAVPGAVTRKTSAGTNSLIRDGAEIVTSIHDIFTALNRSSRWLASGAPVKQSRKEEPPTPPPETASLLQLLSVDEPLQIESLACRTRLPIAELLEKLQMLEESGHVRRLAGCRFQRRAGLIA